MTQLKLIYLARLPGAVVVITAALVLTPLSFTAKVNADPEGEAWFFRVRLADDRDLAGLMTKDQYTEFVKGL